MTFSNNVLWTTSLDKTLRVWDYTAGKCQHVINERSENAHTDKITSIMPFQVSRRCSPKWKSKSSTNIILMQTQHSVQNTPQYEGTSYLATSSCDKSVKIWDCQGKHMVTSDCGNEVISIGLVTDSVFNTNKSVLLCGLSNGRILVRSLPSLVLLATFDPNLVVGHKGAVMSIVPNVTVLPSFPY